MLFRFMALVISDYSYGSGGIVNARTIHSCVNIVENERVFQVPSSSSEREIPE